MSAEHRIDLSDGSVYRQQAPDPDPQEFAARAQAQAVQRRREQALARLRSAAADNGDIHDLLTLLGL